MKGATSSASRPRTRSGTAQPRYDWHPNSDLRLAVSPDPPEFGGPVLIPCPWHEDTGRPNLHVYPDGAKCFRCGVYKAPFQFLGYLNGLDLKRDRDRLQALADELMQSGPVQSARDAGQALDLSTLADRVRTWQEHAQLGPPDCKRNYYTTDRMLTASTVTTARLGYTGRAYTIPLTGWGGTLIGAKFRRDDAIPDQEGTPRYWNYPGTRASVYYPPILDWSAFDGKPAVLVEGEFDALLLAQHGVPAITPTNGVGSVAGQMVELLKRHKAIVVAVDMDEAGGVARTKLYVGCVQFTWPERDGKDPTDVFRNGHAEGWINDLRRAYRDAVKFVKGV